MLERAEYRLEQAVLHNGMLATRVEGVTGRDVVSR